MALGKIKADTLEHSTAGSIATNYVVEGSAKAWCAIDGDSTVNDSLNIASTTDNGNGDNTYTFSNAMGNATFAVSGMSKSEDSAGVRGAFMQFSANNTSIATTFFRLTSQYDNTTVREASYASTIAHGDLA
tara:strand:+ start:75 stop:467 length:393 start_codon:yes stop_codon:yes gene_type:complete